MDAVVIGAAFTAMAEMISRILQLGNDTLHCAFGNTNPIGHVAHPHLRLSSMQSSTWAWLVKKSGPMTISLSNNFVTGACTMTHVQ